MFRIQEVNKQEFLKELINRIISQQINKDEVFFALENLNQNQPEEITKYKKINFSELTEKDWKKACETLKNDSNYQQETKLWDNVDDG